jgi:hypothetical protein
MLHVLSDDVALRWIVSALLGASIATYVYFLVRHARWTGTVDHCLHLTMLAAMILMAWRIDLGVPALGPIIFFLAAGIWFVHEAGTASLAAPGRLNSYYSAAMMAAMAWMYTVMNGSLPGQTKQSSDMSGMDMNMPGMEMSPNGMSRPPSAPGWITSVNWIAALGFAIMALYWSYRYFAERRGTTLTYALAPSGLTPVYQACGAAGAALMFGCLL